MRGQVTSTRTRTEMPPSLIPRTSRDQWMIDVLADLQEAARDRGMQAMVEQLAIASHVAKEEIARKKAEAIRRATEPERRPSGAKQGSYFFAMPPSERRN